MKKTLILISTGVLFGGFNLVMAQEKMKPEDTEFWEPVPKIITASPGIAPSDAVVLFDGSNLESWESVSTGKEAEWIVEGGFLTVNPKKGDIRTKQNFEDYQLHLEWRTPVVIKGKSQGRGNSGVFMQGLYEVQILDNYDNRTYSNGQAASIYKQTRPLVNASRKPGEWQTYDIIWTAPRFNDDGTLAKKARVTVLHNGVLVQNNTEVEGTTEYIGKPQIKAHGPGPIVLQDHGDLVSFKNIWIRPL
jgi:hypothetical protein